MNDLAVEYKINTERHFINFTNTIISRLPLYTFS
jgi:hypothetical protein